MGFEMKVNVYIDGFNFYYGMFQSPRYLPWKWLDLLKLSQRLMPNHEINRIRYFTAEVEPTPRDPDKAVRQQTYFRALRTIPCLTIHTGTFLTSPRRQRVIHPISIPGLNPPLQAAAEPEVRRVLDALESVHVRHTEEKGSDVNLASYLLLDACDQDCEAVLIISNDSDLATPTRIVRDRFGLDATVFNPHKGNSTYLLREAATRCRSIRTGVLEPCLFPEPVYDDEGRAIYKPSKWADEERKYRAKTST